jgi:hypothetical protein
MGDFIPIYSLPFESLTGRWAGDWLIDASRLAGAGTAGELSHCNEAVGIPSWRMVAARELAAPARARPRAAEVRTRPSGTRIDVRRSVTPASPHIEIACPCYRVDATRGGPRHGR